MAEHKCDKCDKTFSSEEAFSMHNNAKHPAPKKKEFNKKKIRNRIIIVIILALIGWGVFALFQGNSQTLPPISMQGHIEAIPPSHVLKEPMRLEIQKHMLEHVDGDEGARGGIIINYDCKTYECESGLIENLESFAGEYNYVYVAPYSNMKVKIALTSLRRIETLDEFDEEFIRDFIF